MGMLNGCLVYEFCIGFWMGILIGDFVGGLKGILQWGL